MAYKTISVEPIAGSCGAEVSGVNLAKPINRKTFAEIYEAWLTYQVLFFRNQKLTSGEYLKFARKWGGIHIHPFVKGLRQYPEILEVKKTEADTYTFGNRWHTDQMFAPRPAKATLLYAKETPTVGGDTLYANMYDAYKALSPGMKRMLEPISLSLCQRSPRHSHHRPFAPFYLPPRLRPLSMKSGGDVLPRSL